MVKSKGRIWKESLAFTCRGGSERASEQTSEWRSERKGEYLSMSVYHTNRIICEMHVQWIPSLLGLPNNASEIDSPFLTSKPCQCPPYSFVGTWRKDTMGHKRVLPYLQDIFHKLTLTMGGYFTGGGKTKMKFNGRRKGPKKELRQKRPQWNQRETNNITHYPWKPNPKEPETLTNSQHPGNNKPKEDKNI